MSEPTIEQEISRHFVTGQRIIQAWQQALNRVVLPDPVTLPAWEQAEFELHTDPATGESALKGRWRCLRGELRGSVVIHADGNFFAEYDILASHPTRRGWFIEAVTAWGREEIIKAELRLLKMPE